MHTARDVILALHDAGLSDGNIAKSIGSERATICKVRNQAEGYTGKIILPNLLRLAELSNVPVTRRPAAQPVKRPAQPVKRTAPPTKKQNTYAGLIGDLLKSAQKPAAPARPAAPPPVRPAAQAAQAGLLSYQQVRCAACPYAPPVGMRPEQFHAWALAHPCETRRRGRCPS